MHKVSVQLEYIDQTFAYYANYAGIIGANLLGTRRSKNPRRLRQIRQVEDDPKGDTEDSLEGIATSC